MNRIQQEDIIDFARHFALKKELACSRFLITGATGLIGSTLVHGLLSLNVGIHITCPVRNLPKARKLFTDGNNYVEFIESDLISFLSSLTVGNQYNYIIHCASPTDGRFMSEHPIETFDLAYESTKLLLQYAQRSKIDGFVYVSSLEYYGQNLDDHKITEDFLGYVDATSARSSYSMGKRAAEYLCTAYALEHNIPVKIARLTQTFGAGVSGEDNRVFAQFARSVINETDIVLHTTGESSKPYCYTTDCVSAILFILLRGNQGEAYNVANESTYISIRDMAGLLCKHFFPAGKIIVEPHPEMKYAPVTKLNLDTGKLRKLGWAPQYDLVKMFERLIASDRWH